MFDQLDKLLVKEIQDNIPLSLDPYGEIAEKIGCTRKEVLLRLQKLKEKGYIKRIVAILHHRDSGYSENGMFAAAVPSGQIEEAGRILSRSSRVTHCYERKKYQYWPYNLYAMIHGRNKVEVETVVDNFTRSMEIEDYQLLYSTHEFKKTSLKYF
jgi:siroheme decarboxylase